MNTSKMKKDTLMKHISFILHNIEESIKEFLEPNSTLSVYEKVIIKTYLSEQHMRDVFKTITGMPIKTYIIRRTYTVIVKNMTQEAFNSLGKTKKVYGINNFKNRCTKEFPFLTDDFDISKMQSPLDKDTLEDLFIKQLEKTTMNKMMDKVFKDITKKRELMDLSEISGKILIQENDEIIVDLDKNYFKIGNRIFNINGYINLILEDKKIIKTLPSANVAIRNLSKFYNGEDVLVDLIYINTKWCKEGFGVSNLIDSVHYIGNSIKNVELTEHNFIVFEEGKVWLNTDFYINK